MKLTKLALFYLISLSVYSQAPGLSGKEEIQLKMTQINEALMAKDTSALAMLLHDDLTLGHSNGWIETKANLLETLIGGGVTYVKIENAAPFSLVYMSEKLITSRRSIDVAGVFSGNSFDVKLNVLEVWAFEENRWQLLARQSVNRKD